MNEFNMAWLSEFLLILGAVTLGTAFTSTGNTSPYPFIFGILSVFTATIMRGKLGMYSREMRLRG